MSMQTVVMDVSACEVIPPKSASLGHGVRKHVQKSRKETYCVSWKLDNTLPSLETAEWILEECNSGVTRTWGCSWSICAIC